MRNLAVFGSILLLQGCGEPNPSTANLAATNSHGLPVDSNMSVAQEAGQTFTADGPTDNCAKIRESSSTDPEIRGVVLGMSFQDAFVRLNCERELTVERMPTRTDEERDYIAPHRIEASAGSDKLEIVAVGPENDERVIGMLRTMNFEPGRQPTVQSVEQEALKKYGVLHRSQSLFRGPNSTLSRIQKHGTDVVDCVVWSEGLGFGNQLVGPNPTCGLYIRVLILKEASNQDLVKSLEIMITDGNAAAKLRDAYLRDKQRRDDGVRRMEIDRAKGNTPTL